MRLQRIVQEMTHAAKNGAIYHLWWHPHNFGTHPQESMAALQTIVAAYQTLAATYGFQSQSMHQVPWES